MYYLAAFIPILLLVAASQLLPEMSKLTTVSFTSQQELDANVAKVDEKPRILARRKAPRPVEEDPDAFLRRSNRPKFTYDTDDEEEDSNVERTRKEDRLRNRHLRKQRKNRLRSKWRQTREEIYQKRRHNTKPSPVAHHGRHENKGKSDTSHPTESVRDTETSMLQTLVKDVKELKAAHSRPLKEGQGCNLNGTWISNNMNFILHLLWQNNGSIGVHLHAVGKEKDTKKAWQVNGTAPFNSSGPFLLSAVQMGGKQVGSFMGQCRVCDGKDSLVGIWMTMSQAKDCETAFARMKLTQDVMTRSIKMK